MFRSLILAVALLLCLRADAQMMPFKNYGIKDGLGDNNVQAVIRDNRGLLWVGTDFGVYWFDGKKFYRPQVTANVGQLYVTGFYKDMSGTIWVLTFFNGIFKYHDGRFTNYMVDPQQKDENTNSIADMIQLSPTKYILLTQNRSYIFDGKRFSSFESEKIDIKANGNSVAAIPGQTIAMGTDDGFFLLKCSQGIPKITQHLFAGSRVEKVAFVKNQLWALTPKGAFCFPFKPADGSLGKPVAFLKGRSLKDLAAGRDGDTWVIANNGSFWDVADTVYKIRNGSVTVYGRQNGLPENVQQIYYDNEGIVWFANRKGLSMLADEYYSFDKIVSGHFNDPVTSMLIDDKKTFWVGSINGLAQRKEKKYDFYPNINGASIGYVSWVNKTQRGDCFVGSVAGVLKIGRNSVKKFLNLNSTAFSEGPDHSLWFGCVTGEVWKFDGVSLKKMLVRSPVHEMATALYAGKDFVWVGYRDRGIAKFTPRNDSLILLKEFSTANGYPDMRIRCCSADQQGNVFFGTRTNGVFMFSRGSDEPVAHINTQSGLNANWIRDIVSGPSGTLYLATNNGINVVTGNYKHPQVRYISINDDNINRETNCILKDGTVFYVGTNEGILKWMPANIRKDTVAPPVYLTKISIQGLKGFSVAPYTSDAGSVELPYDRHFISFEFAGVSLKDPENVFYHYSVTGQDNGWSPLTRNNDVAFDLKPGSYTFKVAAKNADGTWSRRPAIFHFIIDPPFWLSWWFVLIMTALTVFVAYSAYRYKLSKALAIELLRNKISNDLHDDIGSTLSSISILSEVAAREKEQKSKRILGEINERSHLLMEKMDDIVWSISTQNDTIGNLFSRIQQFASTILEARNIDYEFRVPDKLKEMKLDMQRRQHIYLVLKEAINNLIKYSGCSTVCILAEYSGGLLKIEVADDGKGFDTTQQSSGNGLLNMQKRAEAMRGKFCIASSPGKGTRVSLAVQIE